MCAFKDIFGKPKEGVHAPRFLGMAAVDLGLTALLAYWVHYRYGYSFLLVLFGLMVLAVVVHKLFCVDTALNNFLFNKK